MRKNDLQLSHGEVKPEANGAGPLLSIRGLEVTFATSKGPVRAVDSVDIEVSRGETLGLVGESGSGKTVTLMSALGLLPRDSDTCVAGAVDFLGENLLDASPRRMRQILGRDIGVVFQDPLTSLNPVFTVGQQLVEAVRVHDSDVGPASARSRAVEALELVEIPMARERLKQHPHELSGGLRQRVMIAMAVINRPKLLIADEPTTALDVTIQAQILDVLKQATAETGAAMVMITHDLGVVAEIADRVTVMYGGRVVERGPVGNVFASPSHPYTVGLLGSMPRIGDSGERLRPIPGDAYQGHQESLGCAFAPRCQMADGRDLCASHRPNLEPSGPAQSSACHFFAEVAAHVFEDEIPADEGAQGLPPPSAASTSALVQLSNAGKVFQGRHSLFRTGRSSGIRAVSGVDLTIHSGEVLALVGESGSGKSTLGRLVMRMIDPSTGVIEHAGFTPGSRSSLRALQADLQIVFQDPYSSLDPRMRVRAIVAEPLRIHGRGNKADVGQEARRLLQRVGLGAEFEDRFPHQLSGGQRQRVGIARALALGPRLLVLDEPVSALDVSVQAQVVNLLQELKKELDLAYLFISHDLSVVHHIADRVAVMYLGKIVEVGTKQEIFDTPAHPYTKALLSAVPVPDPGTARTKSRIILAGEIPSPSSPPSGCPFRTRCWKATDLCAVEMPALEPREGLPHPIACHYPERPDERPDQCAVPQ